MSNSSRSEVTITLGSNGQVVKRAGVEVDSSLADSELAFGRKRYVRDRLGSNVNLPVQFNKRIRGDGSTANGMDDVHLSRDDLRFKILQKSVMKQKQSENNKQNRRDLRNLLSRHAQSSTNSLDTQANMSKPMDRRLHYSELRDSIQYFQEPKDGRQLVSVTRDSGHHVPEAREQRMPIPREQIVPVPWKLHMSDPRERLMSEAREVRHAMLNASHQMSEPSSTITEHIPGKGTAKDVTKVDSVINSYSPWNLDSFRQNSWDELFVSSKSLSQSRGDEELQRRLPVRTYDDAGTSTHMSKDVFKFPRSVNSAPFMTKVYPSAGPAKTLSLLAAPLPRPGSDLQRSLYAVNDHPTVDSFLKSLDLEKYAIVLKAEEVDMHALRQMGDSDLKELGIPMGPRKKILLSLKPGSKRQE